MREKIKYEREKDCYCYACKKAYHHLGIARHRAMHRRKKENCEITFSKGNTIQWNYGEDLCWKITDDKMDKPRGRPPQPTLSPDSKEMYEELRKENERKVEKIMVLVTESIWNACQVEDSTFREELKSGIREILEGK